MRFYKKRKFLGCFHLKINTCNVLYQAERYKCVTNSKKFQNFFNFFKNFLLEIFKSARKRASRPLPLGVPSLFTAARSFAPLEDDRSRELLF